MLNDTLNCDNEEESAYSEDHLDSPEQEDRLSIMTSLDKGNLSFKSKR